MVRILDFILFCFKSLLVEIGSLAYCTIPLHFCSLEGTSGRIHIFSPWACCFSSTTYGRFSWYDTSLSFYNGLVFCHLSIDPLHPFRSSSLKISKLLFFIYLCIVHPTVLLYLYVVLKTLLFNLISSLSFVVVEHAYQLGNATQKQSLLMELYSTELQLFKDLGQVKERR